MKTNEPAVSGIRDILMSFGSALNAKDVSKLFKISLDATYKQAKKGTIPSFRVGGSVRFDPKRLAEWYERQ